MASTSCSSNDAGLAHSRASSPARGGRVPVYRDSHQDTQTTGARHIDHGGTVHDCSTWTADERLARKKEGHAIGRNHITLADWKKHKGRPAADASTSATTGDHYRLRESADGTATSSATEHKRKIWEPGKWARSLGHKRRVYVPDERRNAKRYEKNNGCRLALITYNAMYAANGQRIQDMSHTFPHAVVGVRGAKQKRDPDAPAYKTRKQGNASSLITPILTSENEKEDPQQAWQSSTHTKWRPMYP